MVVTNSSFPVNVKSYPLVTIGLPTYNRPEGLQKALDWMVLQTYPNLEIFISDNHSTNPEVQQITSAFAAGDKRITVFRQQENIGLENNFNFLYKNSTAPYFIWMSDDDYFEANYIQECVGFLEEHPNYVLCSGTAKYYAQGNFQFEEQMFSLEERGGLARLFTFFRKVGKNGNFYGVFRHGILATEPIGNHIGCDWSFMAKLALLGSLGYLKTTAYHRSVEGNSGTRRKMIEKYKFNKWQALFFETYSAYLIATHIFNDPTTRAKAGYLKRKLVVAIVFFQINFKLFFNFVKKVLG